MRTRNTNSCSLIDRGPLAWSPQKVAKMKTLFSSLPGFIGRHWLRILIVGFALFVLTRKQVNFNIKLGEPGSVPVEAPVAAPVAPPTALSDAKVIPPEPKEEKGFLSQFNLFGGGDDITLYDGLGRVEESTVEAFLRRFSNVAQAEQDKFGIPASITLANALLQTAAGTTEAATSHNNFFALTCTNDWVGMTGSTGAGCVRAYESAWTSFRDHSLYLTSGKFSPLTQFSETDYRRWAAGMEELEFNDTDDLARQLVRTVDRYQLFRFD